MLFRADLALVQIDPDEWNQIVFGLMGLDAEGNEVQRNVQQVEGTGACAECVVS